MQKFTRFFKTRGLLVAVGLCALAAGVAGINVINDMIDRLGTAPAPSSLTDTPLHKPDSILPPVQDTPVANPQQNVPITTPAPEKKPADSAVKDPTGPAPADSAAPAPAAPRFARPVAGAVTAAFSGDELLYNATMADWRTHNGTDFAAAYGETVCSITAGTVKTVAEDALWGWTVEVESPEGLLRYSGLAAKPVVKAGAAVAVGDALGKLDQLHAEIAADPHLHVEYEKDGRLLDVMTLLEG